ncbi:hypothetical protein SAMN05660284_02489 [Formivibrio citricus]|uniref:Uncharacterized protein n=1 Tax=Formivibrio citricus TaxID=83765 RepID=A0A1I5CU95_9NEIS|nr:hypothetical protein [Formivibrio citricus]SFN90512.1 hypothetical protein SAMN05660284_02489 [Formivibrio citricus]
MLIFLDTEFTDFIDCELISIGMVSEDGQHSLYLEVADFDRSRCNAFVQDAVLPLLGRTEGATVIQSELACRLQGWFASLPRSITLACDSQHDRDLLADALDGELPVNLQGWFDLRPLIDTSVFHHAVMGYHTPDRPWHHALHDAHAHRAGWMAWMDAHKHRE